MNEYEIIVICFCNHFLEKMHLRESKGKIEHFEKWYENLNTFDSTDTSSIAESSTYSSSCIDLDTDSTFSDVGNQMEDLRIG